MMRRTSSVPKSTGSPPPVTALIWIDAPRPRRGSRPRRTAVHWTWLLNPGQRRVDESAESVGPDDWIMVITATEDKTARMPSHPLTAFHATDTPDKSSGPPSARGRLSRSRRGAGILAASSELLGTGGRPPRRSGQRPSGSRTECWARVHSCATRSRSASSRAIPDQLRQRLQTSVPHHSPPTVLLSKGHKKSTSATNSQQQPSPATTPLNNQHQQHQTASTHSNNHYNRNNNKSSTVRRALNSASS